MARYWTYTRCEDPGPFVGKLILELPDPVRAEDVRPEQFSVYVERRDRATGDVVTAKAHHGDPDETARPSRGYVRVLDACACDPSGRAVLGEGRFVCLTLPEERLTKRIDGDVLHGHLRASDFTVTQVAAIPAVESGGAPQVGLVWGDCAGDVCPALAGWDLGLAGTFDGIEMGYGLFTPDFDAVNERRANPGFGNLYVEPLPPLEKVPLLLWLHGAGEGGGEVYRTVIGNLVTALSGRNIQDKLGGAAYVLAPSCPTFWMDSGDGGIDDDNQSIYSAALKELVDAVVEAHPAIDPTRIYVGGLSNGGFMTVRLMADYPGFWAAAVPVCAPWRGTDATDEEFAAIARTPQWWVQVDDDTLVKVDDHIKTTWPRLMAEDPDDAHLTYYDHFEDETGRYHDVEGRPTRYNGHFIWVNVYHDTVRTELDGTNVLWDGFPVTLWQWVGRH